MSISRSKGEGTYQRLPGDKVRLVKTIRGLRVRGPSASSKPEARRKFEEKLAEIESKAEVKRQNSQNPTLSWFFHEQLTTRLSTEMAPATVEIYRTVYERHIRLQPIGDIRIHEVNALHIEEWKQLLQARCSARSVARYLQCLKALLQRAEDLELISKNPARKVLPPKFVETEKRVLSPKERDQLLTLDMPGRIRTAVLLCLHGLRRSEACGLKFEDYKDGAITIRRQAQEINGKMQVRELKTVGSRRRVYVNEELKRLLNTGKSGFVLSSSSGLPMRPRNLARDFDKATEGTSFEGLNLHDLRSTFAMILLEKGTDVRTASELLGHSPAMLAKIYARSRDELKARAVANVWG